MTDKKESILDSALELFANQGYNAVSTSKIAQHAGVSEGLIFKHFKNKQGLLDAILSDVDRRIKELMGPILFEEDPQRAIEMYIDLPFKGKREEYDYWRLLFGLKWNINYQHDETKLKPITDKLVWAFTAIKVENPEKETAFLMHLIDSVSMAVIRGELEEETRNDYKEFILKKYRK